MTETHTCGTELTASAQRMDPDAIGWRGDLRFPLEEQRVMMLGTPLEHAEFVRTRLAPVSAKIGRPNRRDFRVVHPTLTSTFAAHPDASLRRALSLLVSARPPTCFGTSPHTKKNMKEKNPA